MSGRPAIVTSIVVCASAALAVADPDAPPPAPGKLIDLGGRRLHLDCTGTGSPAVIVENGSSSFSFEFALVQPAVAKTTQICTYDRAGFAWSDAGPTQDTIEQTVDDLHLLLTNAGVRPPYVLVGASLGGIFVRSYQRRYPSEVVGLVLDDPTSDEGLGYTVNGKDKPIYEMSATEMHDVGAAYLKKPPPPPTIPTKLEDPADRLPKELHAIELWATRKYFAERDLQSLVFVTNESWRQEFIALRRARLRQAHVLGNLPLIVLARNEDDRRKREVPALVGLSAAGKLVVAPGACHELHLCKPELVIDAIRTVVTAARSVRPH